MKNMLVERWVLWGFIAAAVVLMLLGGIAWRSAVRSDEVSAQVMLTHRVSTAAGQIMFNLTRAETAQRGYAIYGTQDYLANRDESLLDVVKAVGEAERLIVVPEQQERLRQLKKLIAKRMEVFLRKPEIRNANDQLAVVGFDSGIPLMDQIYHAIGRIVEMENARLLEREAEHVSQRKIENISFALLSVILPLLLFFLLLRIRRAMSLIRDDEEVLLQDAKLEETSRMKSEFLAHMSHEMRTPINAIMGFSELLKDGRLGKLTKAQCEYVGEIYNSGQHLLSLVNNILDLSRIEAGKMALDLEPVEISELLASSLSIVKEKAASQRVRLHLDVQQGLGGMHVDTLKVRQILYNLLSNAVKFAHDDGQLNLCARRVSRSEVGHVSGRWPSRTFPLDDSEFMEFLEISVADSGIGIARDGLERLFQPYSRIDSGLARKFEGTGLGLMLVKHLAELHGGTVAVESAEGQGSRFTVWLPLRPDIGAGAVPEELRPQQFASETIRKTRKIRAGPALDLAQQGTGYSAEHSLALN